MEETKASEEGWSGGGMALATAAVVSSNKSNYCTSRPGSGNFNLVPTAAVAMVDSRTATTTIAPAATATTTAVAAATVAATSTGTAETMETTEATA